MLALLVLLAAPLFADNPPSEGDPYPDFFFTGELCPGCPGADLSLAVDDGSTVTAKGATDVYELAYANEGVDVATGVTLTATVPANATFDPTESSAGWQRVGTSDEYRFALFELTAGEEGTARFAVKVSTSVPVGTVISFAAHLADDGAHGPDRTPDDNAVADDNLITQGPTFACGTLTEDTEWTALDGPYIVTCDVVIPAGVTLTLEPGTVVKFNAQLGMIVHGSLTAVGTAARPGVFTSNRSRLRRGDWDGIDVLAGGEAVFEHALVEYGGATQDANDALIYAAAGATVTVRDARVRFSDTIGLWSDDADVVVERATFEGHDLAAVQLTTRSPANPSRVVASTFEDNRSHPLVIQYANGTVAEVRGNTGDDNAFNSVEVSGTLVGPAAWGINPGLPYVVGADLTVGAGGELAIEPGVVVKLETASSDLVVDGLLTAAGSEDDPVVFTSFADDTAGGDTNGDGAATAPQGGDWGQVYFRLGARPSRLERCVVAYGGAAFGAVRTDSSDLTVDGCTVRDSGTAGLYAPGAAPVVRQSRFETNAGNGVHLRVSSTHEDRPALLDGNTFLTHGGHAVFLDLAEARGGLTLKGNAATGNATNGVAVKGTLAGDFTVDSTAQINFALRLVSDLTVRSGATLTLSPGTVVKADDPSRDVHVSGSLKAAGTAGRRVVFTSFKDDAFAGDTNGDGAASQPAAGDWGQIHLRAESTGNELRHAVLAWGGATGQSGATALLRVETGDFVFESTTLRSSQQHGLAASNASFDLTGVRVESSALDGVRFDQLTGAVDVTLDGVTLLGNGGHAVYFDLANVAGRIALAGNVAAGNGVDGAGLLGTAVGDLELDWTDQVGLAPVLEGDLTVRAGAALTLTPGTVLKARSAAVDVDVYGSLIAAGTPTRPVVFTSLHDDGFAGDTTGDGDATAPAPGDWGQVRLRAGSRGHLLEHCVIAWGGATGQTDTVANLRVDGAAAALSECIVRGSRQHGIYALDAAVDLAGVTVDGNAGAGVFYDDMTGAVDVDLEANRFTGNGTHAVFLDLIEARGRVAASGNVAGGNRWNGVSLAATVDGPLAVDWSGQAGFALRLDGDLTVRSGGVLTLSRGTVVKGAAAGHDVHVFGTLIAEGTEFEPVVFTSIRDDARGGDTDGGGGAPAPGDWGQLWLRNGAAASVLRHVVVAYGGALGQSGVAANLRLDTGDAVVDHVTVERSAQHGVYTFDAAPDLTAVRLADNAARGVFFDDLAGDLDLTLDGVAFTGNGGDAAYLDLREVRGRIVARGSSALGNGVDGLVTAGTVAGPLSLDWSGQDDLAVVLAGDLTVRPGAVLELSPGLVVKASAPAVDVQVFGTLTAAGTAARPVVFTSFKDDARGGDTNADGGATAPAAGDWGQVWLRPGSAGHTLRNFVIAYGGAGGQTDTLANLRANVGDLALSDGVIERSAQDGLYAGDATFDVAGVLFDANAGNALLFNNLHGAVASTLAGNAFTGNGGHAVFFDLEDVYGHLTASANAAAGNGVNGVGMQGTIRGGLDVDLSAQASLAIRLNADLVVDRGARLTLSPGTVVKGAANHHDVWVDGTLIAEGTAAQPVVFTSINDDTHGGDTNGDGNATSPAPGDWAQVWLRPGSAGHRLSHCVVRYAGATGLAGRVANLRIDTPAATVSSCAFESGAQNGVYVDTSTAPPPIAASSFAGNAGYGLFNAGAATVDARDNWWGDPSGPFHPTLNPGGLGDPVSDNVLFDPWRAASGVQPLTPALRRFLAPRARAALVAASAVPGGTAPQDAAKENSPPLPAGFYGTVTAGATTIPAGTLVAAWIRGEKCAEVPTRTIDGVAVYALNIPADVPGTPGVEGGVNGDTVVLKVAGADADQTGLWQSAGYERLDLTTTADIDLSITASNGADTLAAGELTSYLLAITSSGAEAATGVTVTATLPADVAFVSASDGGTLAAGVVGWPAFDLAPGASVTRVVTVRVGATLPAGVDQVVLAAAVRDDGTRGIDATPEDNEATDADPVDAAPDLAIAKTDGLDEVLPGAVVRYALTIANQGTQGTGGVMVTDTLPAAVTFFAASHDGIERDGVVEWPPISLAAGDAVTYEITLRLDDPTPPGLFVLTNTATVADDGANGADLDPADNSATDLTTVIRAPDLTVASVDVSALALDLETLEVAGSALLELANGGNLDAPSFDVTLFEDADGDGAFTAGTDVELGGDRFPVPLAAGDSVPFAVAVAGTVAFRGSRVYAFVDSAGEVAELDESNNVNDSGAACQVVPTPEDFAPVVERRWPEDGGNVEVAFSRDSISTPLVVPLTDDNGDGRVDENDVPSIVFTTIDLTFPLNLQPRIRAVRGDTLARLWDVIPPISNFLINSLTGAAAGDIDNDGRPEIVFSAFDFRGASGRPNRLLAYNHNGSLKWISQPYNTHADGDTLTNRDNPSIADLDGDGTPEIIVGANVFNANGSLRWRGTGGHAFQSVNNLDDHRSGAISVVANLDLVGSQEIVTGNTAYRADGSILWQLAMDDGYPAVANFDDDPNPEIVVVAHGTVRLHEHDGTLVWGPLELPGAGPEAGGAPTVADFDADGKPEIGVAGSTTYTVFETDGSVKWQRTTRDASSAMTGSTVFDFDGDGRFEVVYRDEQYLRVYRGEDGTVLFQEAVSSQTFNEEVVVADVDRDGRAEIVISSDRAPGFSDFPARTSGIFIYGDANDNWVGTRTIWNQQAYHVDNVADDGTIPRQPAFSWLTHNTFRAQVAPPEVSFASSDLTASRGRVDVADFPSSLGLSARIGNAGGTFVAAGLPVAFYDGDPAAGGRLIATTTAGDLAPGDFDDVSVVWPEPPLAPGTVYIVADDDGTGQGFRNECDEANNVYAFAYDLADVGLFLTKSNGLDRVHVGDATTYTLAVTNYYPSAVTGVGATDTLPAFASFVSASDDGAEAAPGTVVWPPFTLGPGETATRTLTVRVAAAVPTGTKSITNTATVTDDGARGPDPTPQNNTATDTDDLLTFRAEAGGPYTGGEGVPIQLDASGTSDPDGLITAYAWDVDADGLFDDLAGVTPQVTYDDEGSFTAALRVTAADGLTDFDAAAVNVSNLPPAVDAGADQTVVEGDPVALGVTFTDPGLGDTHSASIDWADGTLEAGTVGGTPAAGTVTGSHVYPDDGAFDVEVCVADDDGAATCDTLAVTVENAAPVVQGTGVFDLTAWRPEHVISCYDSVPVWEVAADGAGVSQTQNSAPAFFYSNFLAVGTSVESRVRVLGGPLAETVGDVIGFAIGFQPGATTDPAADYLLLDWRRDGQTFNFGCGGAATGRAGLALSRVHGAPVDAELWAHDDRACNGPASRVEEIARGATLGASGWEYDREYAFTLVSSRDRLQVYVNGALEIDVTGDFPDGRVAFYGYSQARVITSGFSVVSIIADEGETVDARVGFTDAGVTDSHTATLDWGDGTAPEPGTITEVDGFPFVTGSHLYADDGELTLSVCVTDDDGGTGCGEVPVTVRNLPPVVEAGEKQLTSPGETVTLDPATFTDAGVDDVHTATVDWGDGTVDAGVVSEAGGAGTVEASHVYSGDATFIVEVCVTDNAGDTGCDSFQANGVVDLGVGAGDDAGDTIEPGQTITYTLTVTNTGTLPTSGTQIIDTLPDYTSFVDASDGGVYDAITDTVTWDVGTLEPGETVTVTLTVQVDYVLPVGAVIENTVTATEDGSQGPNVQPGDPGDDTGGTAIRTPPDLYIPALDASGAPVDLEDLSFAGTVAVEVANQGGDDVVDAFRLTVFEDSDGDRAFTVGADTVLGEAEVTDPVAAGASLTVPVAVAGTARFRGDLLWAFVDSTDAVAEVDETNNMRSTGQACRVDPVVPGRTYTLDADFDEGVLFNVNHDPPHRDELRLNRLTEPFPFLWVAVSGRGTAVKIDTVTGTILGEYYTAPDGRGRDPSRTTVDLAGNVWVGNRAESSGSRGSVVHIGLAEAFQCVDRNGNGVIDTSTGLGDLRPWPNTGGADNNGGVSTAADECILHYVRTRGTAVRTVAVNRDNDVWVGGLGNRVHDLVDGETGAILDTIRPSCGGYGGFVHPDGTLWSARNLLRYDPVTDVATCIDVPNSYGLGVDSEGDVWNSQWSNATITQLAADGTLIDVYPTGGGSSRGVAVTADDHVWVANSGSGTVTRLTNDGDLVATVRVGNTPTGVAVDAAGKVWVTNLGSNNVMRIDPATNAVDLTVSLGGGAAPYNYSDMTGAVALGRTAPQGRWTVTFDSGAAATPWGRVDWTEYLPAGATVTARARSAETAGALAGELWVEVEKGLEIEAPAGRFLQAELNFRPSPAGDTPIVYDVTIEPRTGLPDLTADFLDVEHRLDAIDFTVRIGNGGDAAAPAGTPVALYDGDPAAGGTLIAVYASLLRLAPGQFQDVRFTWEMPPAGVHDVHVVANDDGTGTRPIEECELANNVDAVRVVPAPDLLIPAMDRSGVVTDFQALTVSGSLDVDLLNQGNLAVAEPFTVTLWEDADGDGLLDAGADTVLGTAEHTGTIDTDQTATLAVPVAGAVRFRDNVIHAFADSALVIAERDEDNNTNSTGALCEVQAPAGQFDPAVEWHWTSGLRLPDSKQVMMTPAVADLTGDGVPEVIFITFTGNGWTANAHLRAVDGRDGSEVFTVTDPDLDLSSSEIAVGDLDLDGRPEIVALAESKERLLAFEHDGTFKWRSHSVRSTTGSGAPALADLDQDGTPEIVFGADVLASDGTRWWSASLSRGDNHGTAGGISLVADLDLDGAPEVVAGNVAYRADGSVFWNNMSLTDGFNAIGNFDADDYPEVVLVDNGSVYLLEHDGSVKWGPVRPAGLGRGGPPTVADVDGDGEPEIAVAGSSRFTVLENDGSVRWQAVIQDGSSNVTGSSVFDFEGDGSAELVYADELHLFIYRGTDGAVLYELPRGSATVYEMPVVADVDADGNAEIVVAANDYAFGTETGIFVIGDAGDAWVPTRKLWNQHTYHVGNVDDDFSIPRREEPSWLAHNTYRLNLLGTSALAAPDLTASRLLADAANPGIEVRVTVRVGNGGALFVPAGVPVAFYDGDPAAGGTLLGSAATSRPLAPEQFEDVSFVWTPPPAPGDATVFAVVDPDAGVRECDEANNVHSLTFTVPPVPDLALGKDDGRTGVVPGLTYAYTLTVTNVGSRGATGVALEDALPDVVSFVAASDGGTASGGVVTWPPFDLATGASAERTLTVRVDASLPPSVTEVTNTATVIDDGSGGLDPTPANNVATDVNGRRNEPSAVDDAATTPEDVAVAIDVLANDSDDDGDPLAVASVGAPAHGTAELLPDGTVLYTPAPDFFGDDAFTYTVTDGADGTSEATVTVTVTPVNDPPVAVNDLAQTDQDVPVALDLLANDSDPENDPLSFLELPQPFGGTVALNPDGTLTYTPAPGFVGYDSFPYTITDGPLGGDRGGEVSQGGSDTALVQVNVLPIDEEPPVIVIAGVGDGDCVNTDVTIGVSASDDSRFELTVTLNGEPFESGSTVTAEGDYTVEATATDVFGNSATETVSFTIDKTPPSVDVAGVPDGQCVNVPVTPEIAASDAHLETVTATLNGEPFASGSTVTAEGDYVLEVTASDGCGNVQVETRTWTIDVTPPAITVFGVMDGAVVNTDVMPSGEVTDAHLGEVTFTLNGEPLTLGTTATEDGVYTFEITANDLCGNASSTTVTFTIDKTPPAIAIEGVEDDGCVNAEVVPVVSVTDANLAGSSVTLNGAPFTSGTAVTEEGDYTLVVHATDAAGNSSSETRTFTIDLEAPILTIEGVPEVCVNVDVTPLFSAVDDHLGTVTATLNGNPFESGTTITAEGDYTLEITASDDCGNALTETRTFTIDKTPPAIAITGVTDGSIVNTDVTPVVDVTDLHLADVIITLNSAPFTTGTTITDEGDYTLAVTAADDCGNSSSQTVTFTIDKTPPAISITGFEDGACVNVDVTPVVEVTDLHLDDISITLNGAPFTSGTTVTAEGDYTLEVSATDLAGNASSETRTFTIDKTPPTISITGVTDGTTSKEVVTPVIDVTDLHLGPVTITLNGAPYESGTPIDVIGTHALVVTADDLCGNTANQTVTFAVAACELYPIAVNEGTLAGASPGDLLDDIFNGAQPGNFGWLTWTGRVDVPTAVDSLTPPGDSDTYVNVFDPDDHVISIGDWIQGSTGVANAGPIRNALDTLKTMDIVVPVWDEVTGQGSNVRYRTVGFVRVRITDYQLSTPNTISARYLGPVICADEP